MSIAVTLDLMLVKRKVTSRQLAAAIRVSETNLSLIKSGKIKGMKLSTLSAICAYLDCQPADILCHQPIGWVEPNHDVNTRKWTE